MIYLYSGTPGSGKSLHVAKDIFTKLNRKHGVIANFGINEKYIKKGKFTFIANKNLNVKKLIEYSTKNHVPGKEGQTLLVIDECQRIFNSRDFARSDRMSWIDFFSQHRKLGYNVILIAQNDRMIDRQIRALIEYEVKHRKVNNFGFMRFIPFFSLFAAVSYWYGVKEKLDVEFFMYKKKYSKLYDSYFLFE